MTRSLLALPTIALIVVLGPLAALYAIGIGLLLLLSVEADI